ISLPKTMAPIILRFVGTNLQDWLIDEDLVRFYSRRLGVCYKSLRSNFDHVYAHVDKQIFSFWMSKVKSYVHSNAIKSYFRSLVYDDRYVFNEISYLFKQLSWSELLTCSLKTDLKEFVLQNVDQKCLQKCQELWILLNQSKVLHEQIPRSIMEGML
ncbi:unnamed protein product, partial [Didymodactylos carnosus]